MKCYILLKLESPNWKLVITIYREEKSKFTKPSGKVLPFVQVVARVGCREKFWKYRDEKWPSLINFRICSSLFPIMSPKLPHVLSIVLCAS